MKFFTTVTTTHLNSDDHFWVTYTGTNKRSTACFSYPLPRPHQASPEMTASYLHFQVLSQTNTWAQPLHPPGTHYPLGFFRLKLTLTSRKESAQATCTKKKRNKVKWRHQNVVSQYVLSICCLACLLLPWG